jgi:hypothetical protein
MAVGRINSYNSEEAACIESQRMRARRHGTRRFYYELRQRSEVGAVYAGGTDLQNRHLLPIAVCLLAQWEQHSSN